MFKNDLPLISIVIPSFNQGKFIEETITSVLGQNYPNLELIIIDGGSTDETIEIIEKYGDSISYWVSEPDRGQGNAINKGMRLAKGDILAWLNSDDMYLPCTLTKIAKFFQSSEEPKLVYGGCLHFYENKSNAYGILPPDFDAEKLTYQDYIIQPSTFWSRSLWKIVGEINESYNYVLDWDWFIRASQVCKFILYPNYLSIYRLHDAHKTGTGGDKRREEIIKIAEAYAPNEWVLAYRDVGQQITSLRAVLTRLVKLRLYRFRHLFYPNLYLKHGHHRIDVTLSMM